ncbi:MAG: hypothetical protein JWQ43_293 [Glaciihabitans sp.]|nr:hypothetical protein [Glaciihabitans sp.]
MTIDVNSAHPIEDVPTPRNRTVAAFDAQLDAHSAADFLIFSGIPVDQVEVVGRDVDSHDGDPFPSDAARVRLNPGWSAAIGGLTGAWTGLLLGLVVSFIASIGRNGDELWPLVVLAIAIGATIGIVLGLRLARVDAERRELSLTLFSADFWDVVVEEPFLSDARRLLSARGRANRE